MKCFGSQSKAHRCKIILLDETELIQEIQSSHKGQDVLDIVFKHLSLLETVYFGLRFVNSKGYSCWLEPNSSVIKQIKGIEPITFYFGVKFYATDPCKLLEECTRYQFFLQIKQDIQQSRLPVTNELAVQLLAFVIQSELGDYDPRAHQFGYVSEFRLIGSQSTEFEHKVCDLHKKLIGQIPAAVELQFLERIKWLDLYGCELHPVIAEDANEYFIGLSPHGIIVLKNKLKVGNYFWPRVLKVFRKGRFFMIKVIDKENEENTYGFEMVNKEASKHIYKNCKEHQEFFKLCQNGTHLKTNSKYVNKPPFNRSNATNGDRPAPTLVRVPSRRYQRLGIPDGSEGESKRENNQLEMKPNRLTNAMSRHNSTPSLIKTGSLGTRYTSPYAQYETCNNSERGLFSKSASASPLSVRSAFVSRYDYGRNNYVSHMKRNTSSLSLQKMKYSRISDNESEVSKCSRSSRHSSRSHKCRHNRSEDSGTESDSSRKRRHRRKHYSLQDQPQLVSWNDILEKQKEASHMANLKHSNAVVRNVTNYYSGLIEENDLSERHNNKLGFVSKQIQRNIYLPSELRKYIHQEPIDSSHLSENERKDIKFTNIEPESKVYKIRQSNPANGILFRQENTDSYAKPAKYRYEYEKPLSSANIADAAYDKEMYYGNYCANYDSYLDYSKSQTLSPLSAFHSSQMAATQSTPRVTFQTPHSTAYFSNHDVYQANLTSNLAAHKEPRKTHEMSTEL